ncbi:hypothetical protein [Methylobacterium sp. ID0610]|uniref:hypothetical protein n=1 Tax=Methylobacterium carpenticola TaxID=3344827 RepID=UPI0036BC5F79
MTIEADDEISRSIIFDKAFQNSIHVDKVLFVFGQSKEDGRSHESAILRRLAPEDTDVHRIGCKIAHKQNQRKNPPPGPKRKYYCGFRTAKYNNMQLSGDKWEIFLTIAPEDGEESHVDVALMVHSEDRNERATIKTDAGLALAEAFGPAVEYVCECDHGDEHHPLHKDPECLKRGLAPVDVYYITKQF